MAGSPAHSVYDGLTLCGHLLLCNTHLRVQVTNLFFQLLYLLLEIFTPCSLTLALSLTRLHTSKHKQSFYRHSTL